MHLFRRHLMPAALSLGMFLSVPLVGVQAASPAQLFQTNFRAVLDGVAPSAREVPPNGSSEPVVQANSAPSANSGNGSSFIAGHDLTSGLVAAGGAMLGAALVILLLGVVAASGQDQKE